MVWPSSTELIGCLDKMKQHLLITLTMLCYRIRWRNKRHQKCDSTDLEVQNEWRKGTISMPVSMKKIN